MDGTGGETGRLLAVVALDLPVDRRARVLGILVPVHDGVGVRIGSPLLVEDRGRVERLVRRGPAVRFIARLFAATAAHAQRQVGQKAEAVRPAGKFLGSAGRPRSREQRSAEGQGPEEPSSIDPSGGILLRRTFFPVLFLRGPRS